MRQSFLYIFILLFLPNLMFAQFGGSGGGFGGGGGFGSSLRGGSGSSGPQTLARDTSNIYYFYAHNPAEVFPFRDSLLDNAQQWDPIRQQNWDYANLGNLGSAHWNIVFEPKFQQGVSIGFKQYDLYQLNTDDVRFYKIKQAYTQFGYSQGAKQDNSYFKIKFSRNFKNGLNLAFDHRRVNDLGYFDNQNVKTSAITAGLWYHDQHERYDGFFTYTTNNIQPNHNGGVQSPVNTVTIDGVEIERDTFLLPAFQFKTNLADAQTRHTNTEFAYTSYYYLGRKKPVSATPVNPISRDSSLFKKGEQSKIDSIQTPILDSLNASIPDSLNIKTQAPPKTPTPTPKTGKAPTKSPRGLPNGRGLGRPSFAPPSSPTVTENLPDFSKKRAFTLYHRLRYRKATYKFWDDNVSTDSTFYGNFLTDSRGLRYFLEHRMVENTFKVQTFKLRKDSKDKAITKTSDLIEIGVRHQLHFLDQEPVDTTALNNLFLTGAVNFSPNDRLKIFTYAHLGLLKNAGDYHLSGELFLDLKKAGNFRAQFISQLAEPSYLTHRLYISHREVWKNNFDKTLNTSILGTYSNSEFKFALNGGVHLLTNQIYYDTVGTVQQTSEAISVLQLMAEKNFKFGPVHFNNQIIWQKSTSNILRLPELYFKHSLFLEGRIFKRAGMLARIGLDARMTSSHSPYAYNPVIGQFQLQDNTTLPFTPLIDAFFSFKLTRFRFYFKMENLLTPWFKTYYYQTESHAIPYGWKNGGARLGFSWRLVD